MNKIKIGLLILFLSGFHYGASKIQVNYGYFEPAGISFNGFIKGQSELSLMYSHETNSPLDLQIGLQGWRYTGNYLSSPYKLFHISVPIRLLYRFPFSENVSPYFGSGAGMFMLIESYLGDEYFSNIGFLGFTGVDWYATKNLAVNFELAMSQVRYPGLDNVNGGGFSARLGLHLKL